MTCGIIKVNPDGTTDRVDMSKSGVQMLREVEMRQAAATAIMHALDDGSLECQLDWVMESEDAAYVELLAAELAGKR